MIGALGNSEYLGRRMAPLLQELTGSDEPIPVGTDHGPRSAQDARTRPTERAAVLASPDITVVYVSSATGRHVADCRAALAAGKHVLVEKPICLRVDELTELDQLAREQHRTVFECLSYRYHPVWAEFVGRVHAGEWAVRPTVSAVFRIPARDAADFRVAPDHGGAAGDLGTYCVDALLALGARPDELRVGAVRDLDRVRDCGVAVAGPAAGHSGYTGLWTIGDEYANSVVVTDGDRSVELSRAFTPPPESAGRVVERRGHHAEPEVVAVTDPATSSRVCLAAGLRHIRDDSRAGVVDRETVLHRVTALEAAARPPGT